VGPQEELRVRNFAVAHQIMGQALQASAQDAGTDMDPDPFRDAWLRLSRSVFAHSVPD
jgi:hypothetical protein